MKFCFAFAVFMVFVFKLTGQVYVVETFEPPYDVYRYLFQIDTVNYHQNIWQIGKPTKAVFGSGLSLPNAIVTDTMNTYPANDTSLFYIKQWVPHHPTGFVELSFVYMLDIDSGVIATVDVTGDSGRHWFNVLTDDTTYMVNWLSAKPRLDTSSGGSWLIFDMDLSIWAAAYSGGSMSFPSYFSSDTLIYRFTFISGSDTSVHKDGWMLDDFYCIAGMRQSAYNVVNRVDGNSIFPNPTSDYFTVGTHQGANIETIQVLDLTGKLIKQYPYPNSNEKLAIDFPEGNYIVKMVADDGVGYQRMTVRK